LSASKQYNENEFRKAFTKSARAAIAEAVVQELGNRQGSVRTSNFPPIVGKSSQGDARDANLNPVRARGKYAFPNVQLFFRSPGLA
jgi:hypothetical protein